jgi:hypothetical protein
MTNEIQAEPPDPRRRRFDDSSDNPLRKTSDGVPFWVWLLIGVGVLFCIVPVLGALTWFLLPFEPAAPMREKPAPTPIDIPEKLPGQRGVRANHRRLGAGSIP